VMSLVWLVGTAGGAAVVMWNGTFVGLWVGDHLYAGDTTTVLVVVLALQLALIRMDTFVIDVALIPRVKVLGGLVAAIASIVLAAVAAGPLDGGVVGLCIGLVLGRAILGLVAPIAVGRFLGGDTTRHQARSVVRPALVTGLVLAGSWWVAQRNVTESWFVLVVGVAGTFVVLCVVTASLGLTHDQRVRLGHRARAVLPGIVGSRS